MEPSAVEVDLVVRAGWLFPVDGVTDAVRNGEVAIKDGKILYSGPSGRMSWRATEIIEAADGALMPGFVNCHCHAGSTVFRSQTEDGAGGRALYSVAFRGEGLIADDDWARMARLGVIEMAKAGITTLNDFWYAPDAMGQAALATGLRMQLATEIVDIDKTRVATGDYTRFAEIGDRTLRAGVAAAERWHGRVDGLVTARLGPHAVDTVSEGLFRECVAEARARGWGLHTHAAQSPQETALIRQRHGCGPVRWLAELGLLGADWVLAHLTFAEAADIEAARACDAAYAHAASIYPRRGVYPEVSAMLASGLRCGMATDWLLNDPFEIMRIMLSAVRLKGGAHTAMTSQTALELATAGAANVMGLGDRVGRLKPGFEADMILVDLNKPHLQPFYGTSTALVWHARGSDVTHSWVRGKAVLKDGKVGTLDESAALNDLLGRVDHLGEQIRSLGGHTMTACCPCGAH